MRFLKQYIVFLFYGIILHLTDMIFCEGKILKFLEGNLLTILITVITLNLTSVIFLFSKVVEEHTGQFDDTIKEIHFSVKEQIIIIPLSLLINCLSGDFMKVDLFRHIYISDIKSILLTGIFMFSIYSIWDIAEAVFQFVTYKSRQ